MTRHSPRLRLPTKESTFVSSDLHRHYYQWLSTHQRSRKVDLWPYRHLTQGYRLCSCGKLARGGLLLFGSDTWGKTLVMKRAGKKPHWNEMKYYSLHFFLNHKRRKVHLVIFMEKKVVPVTDVGGFWCLARNISSSLCQKPEMKLSKGSYFHSSFACMETRLG